VFDLQGDLKREISIDLPNIAVTEKFKDQVWDWLELHKKWKRKKNRQIQMVFPRYFPKVKNFIIRDNRIYCQTYKKRGEESEFIILNLVGKLLKKRFLPHADGTMMDLWTQFPFYAIYKHKYYYLVENLEQDTWELYVVDI
jgi:hypothetical protein